MAIVFTIYPNRDKLGREVDLLYEENGLRNIIEIKAGETISGDYFDSLDYYGGLDSGCPRENRYVIYGGDTIQSRSRGKIRGWKALAAIESYF